LLFANRGGKTLRKMAPLPLFDAEIDEAASSQGITGWTMQL
jgi:hypothetical protein